MTLDLPGLGSKVSFPSDIYIPFFVKGKKGIYIPFFVKDKKGIYIPFFVKGKKQK